MSLQQIKNILNYSAGIVPVNIGISLLAVRTPEEGKYHLKAIYNM